MADITDAQIQDSIAWSLVGENAEAEYEAWLANPDPEPSQYAAPGDELLNDELQDQQFGDGLVLRLGDEGAAAYREKHGQRAEQSDQETENGAQEKQPQERLRSERAPQEAEQGQQHAPTPEEVQQGVEQLDSAVKEYGLNEPADARQFADEFCGAFGTDPFKAGIDVESLGSVMSKTAVSALQVYEATGGDLSKMGEIPPQNAQAFAHDLLKGMGIDLRSMNVDAMLLARTALGGMISFVNTFNGYGGKVTDLAKLNNPQNAEFYMQNFMKALGVEGQVNREAALKFADACGRQMLRVMGKISQLQAQRNAAPQKQTRARGQRVPAGIRDGIRGSRAPRFKSNQDIFSGSAIEAALSQRL